MKPVVIIISNRNLSVAPRVIREIDALQGSYDVVTIGASRPPQPWVQYSNIHVLDPNWGEKLISKIYKLIRGQKYFERVLPFQLRKLRNKIRSSNAAYVIVHEVNFLPHLIKIKKSTNIKVIFNAHEYHPLEFESNPIWTKDWQPYFNIMYNKYVPKVDLLINVCESIAGKCRDEIKKDSIVIPNVAGFRKMEPSDNSAAQVIRLIYHGVCQPERKIDEMIKMAGILGKGYSLDLMLVYNEENDQVKHLKQLAAKTENVAIISPVAFNDIISFTNQYDIGVFLLLPTCFNYEVALPNKLFEYLQARLCIAIGPSIEMKKYVEAFNVGIVSDDFTAASLAESISSLTKTDIAHYKLNAHKAAIIENAEKYKDVFLTAINNIK